MAKVTLPLLSEKASGDLGKIIQFRCGRFVVKKPKIRKEIATEEQNFQREKFKDGIEVWKTILTEEQKTNWQNFAESIMDYRGYFSIKILFDWVYVRIGGKENWQECIDIGNYNGYQYFLCCYLRFGPDGWYDYPNPPVFP